jgi:hypothetical protein
MKNRLSTLFKSRKFGIAGEVRMNALGVHSINDLRTLGSIHTYFLLNELGPL